MWQHAVNIRQKHEDCSGRIMKRSSPFFAFTELNEENWGKLMIAIRDMTKVKTSRNTLIFARTGTCFKSRLLLVFTFLLDPDGGLHIWCSSRSPWQSRWICSTQTRWTYSRRFNVKRRYDTERCDYRAASKLSWRSVHERGPSSWHKSWRQFQLMPSLLILFILFLHRWSSSRHSRPWSNMIFHCLSRSLLRLLYLLC